MSVKIAKSKYSMWGFPRRMHLTIQIACHSGSFEKNIMELFCL